VRIHNYGDLCIRTHQKSDGGKKEARNHDIDDVVTGLPPKVYIEDDSWERVLRVALHHDLLSPRRCPDDRPETVRVEVTERHVIGGIHQIDELMSVAPVLDSASTRTSTENMFYRLFDQIRCNSDHARPLK